MQVKILHLYHDFMNLYGEYANVSCLERYLRQQGLSVSVDKLSLYDSIDFNVYDFVYCGCGTERKQLIALENLLKYSSQIEQAYSEGTVFLMTGNSFELFGKSITTPSGEEKSGLGLFDFYTVVTDKKRTLEDQICTGTKTGKKAVGFINKSSETFGIQTPLFTVNFGAGNSENDKGEGVVMSSFYGTHLTGPILVKNPHIAEFFVKLLCEKKGAEFVGIQCEYEKKSYEITLKALEERFS